MARKTSAEVLENKIAKAQEQVSKTKKQYDRALAVLSELLDKRDAIRKDELMNAFLKSDKKYEEVMDFLKQESEGKRQCRSRKKR